MKANAWVIFVMAGLEAGCSEPRNFADTSGCTADALDFDDSCYCPGGYKVHVCVGGVWSCPSCGDAWGGDAQACHQSLAAAQPYKDATTTTAALAVVAEACKTDWPTSGTGECAGTTIIRAAFQLFSATWYFDANGELSGYGYSDDQRGNCAEFTYGNVPTCAATASLLDPCAQAAADATGGVDAFLQDDGAHVD